MVILMVACESKTPSYVGHKAKQFNMTAAAQDVHLPTELFDEIMDIYKPLMNDSEATDRDVDTKARLEIPTDFFPFHVYLTERTKGILGGNNVDLAFGKGGGELDLKDYLKSERGTFFLGIKPILSEWEDEELRVFFLSNARSWDSENEKFGAGCNVYLDIGHYFNNAMKDDGFKVNVSKQRHVGLLSGTFFMAVSVRGRLFLSQLTIKDSRYKNLHCK